MRDEVAFSLQSSSRDACRLAAVAPWSTAPARLETYCHVRRGWAENLHTHDHGLDPGHDHHPSRNSASIRLDRDICDAGPT